MSQEQMVQECDHEISALFPHLPRPEQKALAAVVSGVVGEESAVLSVASAGIPGGAQDRSKYRRAQRLLANERLAVPACQEPLLARVLEGRRGRLPLLLDATTEAGTVTLALAVGWQGRALPVLWHTWGAADTGQDWSNAIATFLRVLAEQMPAGVAPVLLADRGLSGVPLAQAVQACGWHYLLREEQTTHVHMPTGPCPLGQLVPAPGTQTLLTAVPVTEECFRTNVVAVWESGQAEPWLLLTNLPPTRARCAEYRHRTAEEALSRDLKSFGWQWQLSRVRRPDRVARLLLVCKHEKVV